MPEILTLQRTHLTLKPLNVVELSTIRQVPPSVTGPHQSLHSSLLLSPMLITAVDDPCHSLRHYRVSSFAGNFVEEELKNSLCF